MCGGRIHQLLCVQLVERFVNVDHIRICGTNATDNAHQHHCGQHHLLPRWHGARIEGKVEPDGEYEADEDVDRSSHQVDDRTKAGKYFRCGKDREENNTSVEHPLLGKL